MDIPEFIPGLKLSELFYTEQVAPIMRDRFAVVQHSAALIGPGSEVLGFDDETSTDHHWGPRLQLFLSVENLANYGQQIDVTLRQELPDRCLGYPTSFTSPDPDDNGTQLLDWDHQGEINHMVEITTIERFFTRHLGVEVGKELSVSDWLSFPQQILLSLTAGAVFHDEVGLQDARAKLAYYPHDVWLYLMASVWHRIGNEEHLAGRTGQSDQTLGNSLLLHRLVRDAMYLAFMLEKKYAPYPKWFERAFRDLQCSSKLTPHLLTVIGDGSWSDECTTTWVCRSQSLPRLLISTGVRSRSYRGRLPPNASSQLSPIRRYGKSPTARSQAASTRSPTAPKFSRTRDCAADFFRRASSGSPWHAGSDPKTD